MPLDSVYLLSLIVYEFDCMYGLPLFGIHMGCVMHEYNRNYNKR